MRSLIKRMADLACRILSANRIKFPLIDSINILTTPLKTIFNFTSVTKTDVRISLRYVTVDAMPVIGM